MRRQLMPFLGARYHFAGTVVKFGLRQELGKRAIPTMMLCDVALHTGSQIVVSQHIWVCISQEMAEFNPKRGNRISFDATVQEYYKFNGSGQERLDYNIGQVTGLDLVAGGEGLSLAEYLGNLRQSRRYARDQIEVPLCAA